MPFHPLYLFAFQILTTSLVVGFSKSHARIRLVGLPLVLWCALGIITTAQNHMRLPWASLLSGTGNGFILQYIDLALLSRWSFETRGNVLRPENQGGFWHRFCFGLASSFSFRHVNTPWEVKNVPPFSGGPPSRLLFVARQIVIAVICMLFVDFSNAHASTSPAADLFSPEKERLFSRLIDITSDEVLVRTVSTLIYWLNMYAIMQGVTSTAAAIAVGSGFSEVKYWRPLFGSPSSARDLRSFWGVFWHQTLRQILSNPADFMICKVLMMEGILARYLKLLSTFAISGILHTFAELGGGIPLHLSGTLYFFCLQAVGIMIEDVVKAKLMRNPPRYIGYAWVACFLVWSTPTWLYPSARASTKDSFLPFSFIPSKPKGI